MTTFIEMHALRSFPPSNLNRDDLGAPKTAIFGGSRRLRISSQCLKRTWRTSEEFRGAFAEDQLGVRTARMPEEVLSALGEKLGSAASREGLIALLTSIGKKTAKPTSTGNDPEDGDKEASEAEEKSSGLLTPHLLFLSRQEIEAVVEFAGNKADMLAKVFNKKKVDSGVINKLRGELRDHLDARTSKNAVDVGLFGRFVTSDEFDTVEGALQVAHALGTQKVEVEYDYFTAVDDLGDTAGAGHLGESEYASSVLYLYACCDLNQLEANLGPRTASGRKPDEEARRLARKSLPALVKAVAEATPRGKKTGTAPHTPAEYVEVVIRRGAPLSLANAFLRPVGAADEKKYGDVMTASMARLSEHRLAVETAYDRGRDVVARLVLRLRDLQEDAGAKATHVKTIRELSDQLSAALDVVAAERRT